MDDGELPNAVQASMIGGFGRVHDRELLAPFVTPYFDSLTRVWSERTNEMASQIVVGLYPSTQPPRPGAGAHRRVAVGDGRRAGAAPPGDRGPGRVRAGGEGPGVRPDAVLSLPSTAPIGWSG